MIQPEKLQPEKHYRVYFRYLVVVDVEAPDAETAVELARAEENETGEWDTLDVQVDELGQEGRGA